MWHTIIYRLKSDITSGSDGARNSIQGGNVESKINLKKLTVINSRLNTQIYIYIYIYIY